ncbi:MAG: polysaccharide deacetylase family protein [Proteobacteria bacterium]|nr:polysaccharide deacetylase family protein [Pseudomonadota bacterium]
MKIFLFHRVSPDSDPLWPPIPPERFRAHVRMIKQHFRVIQLEDYLLSGRAIGSGWRTAAIVFDDGYRDFIDYALPILVEEGLRASMYVVTSCADNGVPIWTYRFDHALLHTRRHRVDFDPDLLPAGVDTAWTDSARRLAFARAVKPVLKTLDHAVRENILARILSSLDDVPPPDGMMMDWGDLRRIAGEGIEIGSHTVTHPLLASVADEAGIADEMAGSFRRVEAEMGTAPRAIAYPNGSHDARVRRAAAKAGYQLGLATGQKSYRHGIDDLYAVPRIELYDEPGWKTRARAEGLIEWAKRVRNHVRV